MVNRADNIYHLHRYDESIEEWTHAIQMDPKRAGSYDGRGLAYSYSHRWEQGIDDFTRAIELNPEFSAAYNNRGWSYLETGNLDDALMNLNKALELNPVYTTALFNRAHVFERRGEYAKAIADFSTILHLDPGNKSAADQRAADLRRLPSAPVPAASPAAALGAPKLLSPADGAVFEHYPRDTTLVWAAVPGAAAYTVEVDFKDPRGWASENNTALLTLEAAEPVANFQFVGAQPGRWRVRAKDANGAAGATSEWREFRYTR